MCGVVSSSCRCGLHFASMASSWLSRVDGVAATWHRVDAIDATRSHESRGLSDDNFDAIDATRSHEDDEDAASQPFLATATKPYFSKPLADHSAADGIGASMQRMSACARFAS